MRSRLLLRPRLRLPAVGVILRCDLRDTARLPEPWGVAMPVRSAAFGTLAILGGCLLPSFPQPAHANTPPPQTGLPHKTTKIAPAAVTLPAFQPGLWLYRRTVVKEDSPTPRVSVLKKCADPSTEIRDKMVQLKRQSCEFTPLARRRGRYFSSWICPTPLGPTKFHAVLIVRGSRGYTDLSEMRTREHIARQRIEATRIGECPDKGTVTPRAPNPTPTPPPEVRG